MVTSLITSTSLLLRSSRTTNGTNDAEPVAGTSLNRYWPPSQSSPTSTLSDGAQLLQSTILVAASTSQSGWSRPGIAGDCHTCRAPAPP